MKSGLVRIVFAGALVGGIFTRPKLGPRLRGDDEPASRSPFARILLTLALSGGLVACGFQLRGEQTLPFASLYVSGNTAYSTVVQIKKQLATVPRTKLAVKSEDADANLQILAEEREKFILSLNTAGRVREYDLRLRVSYRLSDSKGNELIPTNEILLTRVLPYDDTQVLAKGEEEVLLYRDMQNDVVGQIMRRVAAVKPKS